MTLRRITATVALFFLAAAITFVLLDRWDEALIAIIIAAAAWLLWVVLEHRTRRQWFVWPVAIALGMIGPGIITSAPANADPATDYAALYHDAVCLTLDDYPTYAGIFGVGDGIAEDGFSYEDAGRIIRISINTYCQRHMGLWDGFAAEYGAVSI